MVYYDKHIRKDLEKGRIPKEIAITFKNAFESLDKTQDFNLFDIKKLHNEGEINYYRLRKGMYRAIFFCKDEDIFVKTIAKREDVYKKWQQ